MVGVGLALGLHTVSVEVQKSGVGSLPCLEARPLDGIPVPAEHGVCVLEPPVGLQSSRVRAQAPETAVGTVKVSVKTTKTCLRIVERNSLT